MDERLRLAGRILFLGICPDGKIIGYLCHQDSELAREFALLDELPRSGVFQEPGLDISSIDERSLLIDKLREIHLTGWICSRKRLFADFNGKEISYYCAVRLSYPVFHSKRGYLFDSFRSIETLGQSPLTTGFCYLSLPT